MGGMTLLYRWNSRAKQLSPKPAIVITPMANESDRTNCWRKCQVPAEERVKRQTARGRLASVQS